MTPRAYVYVAASLASVSCSTKVDVRDLDRSCTVPADCVVVHHGDNCGPCSCGNTAISKDSLAEYEAHRDAVSCTPSPFGEDDCLCAVFDTCCEGSTCGFVRFDDQTCDTSVPADE